MNRPPPILITTFNHPKTPRRVRDYNHCVGVNSSGPFFEVVVFFEGNLSQRASFPSFEEQRVQLVSTEGRPLLSRILAFANDRFPESPIVVANGDICFQPDSQVERVHEIRHGEFWALTRYNRRPDGTLYREPQAASFDSFIFRTPICPRRFDIHLGVLGCDGYIVQKALESGMAVANPCLSIISTHIDSKVENNYKIGKAGSAWTYWDKPDFLHRQTSRLQRIVWSSWKYFTSHTAPRMPLPSSLDQIDYVQGARFPERLPEHLEKFARAWKRPT